MPDIFVLHSSENCCFMVSFKRNDTQNSPKASSTVSDCVGKKQNGNLQYAFQPAQEAQQRSSDPLKPLEDSENPNSHLEENPEEQAEELDCSCTKHFNWGNYKVRSPKKKWVSNTSSKHFVQNVIQAMKLAKLLDGSTVCESCYGYFREMYLFKFH